jgi:hypothetical protein
MEADSTTGPAGARAEEVRSAMEEEGEEEGSGSDAQLSSPQRVAERSWAGINKSTRDAKEEAAAEEGAATNAPGTPSRITTHGMHRAFRQAAQATAAARGGSAALHLKHTRSEGRARQARMACRPGHEGRRAVKERSWAGISKSTRDAKEEAAAEEGAATNAPGSPEGAIPKAEDSKKGGAGGGLFLYWGDASRFETSRGFLVFVG